MPAVTDRSSQYLCVGSHKLVFRLNIHDSYRQRSEKRAVDEAYARDSVIDLTTSGSRSVR